MNCRMVSCASNGSVGAMAAVVVGAVPSVSKRVIARVLLAGLVGLVPGSVGGLYVAVFAVLKCACFMVK